jgi:hypothetical protein
VEWLWDIAQPRETHVCAIDIKHYLPQYHCTFAQQSRFAANNRATNLGCRSEARPKLSAESYARKEPEVPRTPKKSAKKSKTKKGNALPFAPREPARPFLDPDAIPRADQRPPATITEVQENYAPPDQKSTSNVTGDPTQNLQTFTLDDLAKYTREGVFSGNASKDVHLFYVGRDDVHDILKHILSRVTISLYLNMFGFDDEELNNILMQKALAPGITMLITLDKSQAGGVHEKALLEADKKYNLASFNTHFVIGQSKTHQISHTKGFVADGKVAAEGSTNWSAAGEGTFVVTGGPGGPNYKAQNNTQAVITDPDTIIRFQTELITEHMTAQAQQKPEDTPGSLRKHGTNGAASKNPPAKKSSAKKKGTKTKAKAKKPKAAGG